MDYRIYLLGEDGHIRAAENFTAEHDEDALQVARLVHDSCSDVFPARELWRGPVKLPGPAPHPPDGAETAQHLRLSRVLQDTALDLAERLHRVFGLVRESRKLLKAMDDLRAARASE